MRQFGVLLDRLHGLQKPCYNNINVVDIPSNDSSKDSLIPQEFIVPISVKNDVRESFKTSFYNELQEQHAQKIIKGRKLLHLETYN